MAGEGVSVTAGFGPWTHGVRINPMNLHQIPIVEMGNHHIPKIQLFSLESGVIPAKCKINLELGFKVEIQEGHYGLIRDMGPVVNTLPTAFVTGWGSYESGQQLDVKTSILNWANHPYTFHVGDKVGEMYIMSMNPNL